MHRLRLRHIAARNAPPVVAEASTLDAEMHLVSTGVALSITSEAVGIWYKRPGVTFVPILDLPPCSVSLAWWPQDTGLVAEMALADCRCGWSRGLQVRHGGAGVAGLIGAASPGPPTSPSLPAGVVR